MMAEQHDARITGRKERLSSSGEARLSQQEMVELALRAQSGDLEARNRLVMGSMHLVWTAAHRFAGRGLPADDLVSEGILGIIDAIERFDPARGAKYGTFAARLIQHSMQRALGESMGVARLPPKARRLVARWARESQRFKMVHGRAAEPAVLARALGVPAHLLIFIEQARVLQVVVQSESTDRGTSPGDGWDGHAADGRDGRREAAPAAREVVARLREALDGLEPSRAMVIRLHFGLSGARPIPLREVARSLGMSTPRARRCLAEGMRELRRALEPGGAGKSPERRRAGG